MVNDDDHGHGDEGHFDDHHDHYHFDYIEHGHSHRHETIDGYPLIHLFKTEHAWLETKYQLDYARASNTDDGLANESELENEFFWAVNSRFGLILEAPVVFLNPVLDPYTAGCGDIEVGTQFIAFNGEYTILAFGLNVGIPTGDPDRDLGNGFTTLEPKAYLAHDFGGGTLFQGEFFFEIPVWVADPENEFIYNMGISRILDSTCCWPVFRDLAPTLEVNGVTVLNGPEAGATVINITPGLRTVLRVNDQLGAAVSFPISGARQYDTEFLASYILHF